jgi:predicted patatin/cPLA2 family phospholipase
MLLSGKKTIILEGGGFKTSFSAGVLDAFRMSNFDQFDAFIGVSGGSIALSYFLSQQFGEYINSMKSLCKDPRFIQYTKAFSDGLMNLDFFTEIAEKEFPFDLQKAVKATQGKDFFIVLTHTDDGATSYLKPREDNWLDMTIAASTVPLLTKGKHIIDGIAYSDGGISDPIPVQWAVENGATDILLIRTTHLNFKPSYIRPEYFASKFLKAGENIKKHIENYQLKLKSSIDYIETIQDKVKIDQIAPENSLHTNILTNSVNSIILDYRYGLELGLNYVAKQKK